MATYEWKASLSQIPSEGVHQDALSLTSSANCFAGNAILSYLHLAKSMIAQGVPLSQVFGPDNPDMGLLFRHRVPDDEHSACNFAAELSAKVALSDLPTRVAIAVMFTHYLRVCDILRAPTASLTSCGSG